MTTMYLSSLLIDVGDDPDRPRPGRQWLRNLYHVHQRLCMAFPSTPRRSDDPDFLKPFEPGDFGPGQVHVKRADDAGFLFRVDPQPGGRVVILVQSALKPDWGYAFHNADYLLAAAPEVREYTLSCAKGQSFRFRLVANPTKKIDTKSGPDGQRRNGRRVPVRPEQLLEWLARKAESSGFSLVEGSTTIQTGFIYADKSRDGKGQRLRSVRYDGVLSVGTDLARLQETLARGIGSAKAFGFGLLSVAPVKPEVT